MAKAATKLLACGGLVLVAAGCGDGQLYAPLSGVVTQGGEPVAGMRVFFEPVAGAPGSGSRGMTDEDGRYELIRRGSKEPGVLVGVHRVTMSSQKPNPAATEITPMERELAPAGLRDGSARFEVTADGDNVADFELSEFRG